MSYLSKSGMNHLKRYLYVALGGGIGALSRYTLLNLTQNETILFPYSTILINLLGAFLLTFLINLASFNLNVKKDLQIAIIVGMIGSFTTFSLIMTDIINLLATPILLVIYYLITILGGLFASLLAYLLARFLNRRGDV